MLEGLAQQRRVSYRHCLAPVTFSSSAARILVLPSLFPKQQSIHCLSRSLFLCHYWAASSSSSSSSDPRFLTKSAPARPSPSSVKCPSSPTVKAAAAATASPAELTRLGHGSDPLAQKCMGFFKSSDHFAILESRTVVLSRSRLSRPNDAQSISKGQVGHRFRSSGPFRVNRGHRRRCSITTYAMRAQRIPDDAVASFILKLDQGHGGGRRQLACDENLLRWCNGTG